jgi:hypothetical protein
VCGIVARPGIRGWGLPAAVALAVAGCGSNAGPPPPLRPTAAPDIAMYAGMQGHRRPGAADLALIARSARLAVGTVPQLQADAARLRRLRPGIKLYAYVNGEFVHPDQGSTYPASWYLRSAGGQQVRSRVFGNYLMNPLQPGWTAQVTQSCRAALRSVPGLTGCFLDMIGPAPLRPGYDMGGQTPVDPRTGRPFAAASYLSLTGALAGAVQSATGHPVIANGLESGVHYYTVPTGGLADHVAGLEVEHWMGLNDTQARNVGTWAQNEQMLIDLARRGRTVLVNFHTPGGSAEPWRRFAVASFLLAAGPGEYLQIEPPGSSVPSWRDPSPDYHAGLGAPAETSGTVSGYLHGGVYERRYTGGLVLVNPSDQAVTVRLGAGYRDSGGHALLRVTVPAGDGLTLRSA